MSLISGLSHLPTAGKVAIGVGVAGGVIGIAALLTGRGPTSAEYTRNLFGSFDASSADGQITQQEAVRSAFHDSSKFEVVPKYDIIRYRESWTESALTAVNAADQLGDKNGAASFEELRVLGDTFDANQDGRLQTGEQARFQAEYGVSISDRRGPYRQ